MKIKAVFHNAFTGTVVFNLFRFRAMKLKSKNFMKTGNRIKLYETFFLLGRVFRMSLKFLVVSIYMQSFVIYRCCKTIKQVQLYESFWVVNNKIIVAEKFTVSDYDLPFQVTETKWRDIPPPLRGKLRLFYTS